MEGFGRFDKEKTIDFENGVNFITGLNEAGKSTVLEAIMASIFKYTRSQIEPFHCWKNEDVCKTSLIYETEKGERFRVSSDYISGRRRLERLDGKRRRDVAVLDKEIETLIKKHFGFEEKKVFENTVFVRQAQIAILEDSVVKNKVKDMIEEVFAGRAESSATKAVSKMKKIAKDSDKEVGFLDGEIRDLEERLEHSEEIDKTVVMDAGELSTAKKELKEKTGELEKRQKYKKQFDEKMELLKDEKHLADSIGKIEEQLESSGLEFVKDEKHIEESMEKIDELLEISEKHDEKLGTYQPTAWKILIIVGVLLSLTLIGAIIGIPLIIWGWKLKQKEEKLSKFMGENKGKLEGYQKEKKELINKKAKILEGNKAKIEGYRKEKKDLINKKAVIESRLEHYKYIKIKNEDFDDLEDLKSAVEELRDRVAGSQAGIKKTASIVENTSDVREPLDSVQEKKAGLLKKIEEYGLAINFLEAAEGEVHQKFTPEIEKNSKTILKEITNGRYSEVKIDEETLDIKLKAPEIKEYVDVHFLSQGTKDQLYFTLRAVMSDLLAGDRNIPLILDDPFHSFDELRLKRTMDVIGQLAKKKQIILISHRPYHTEFKNLSKNVVEI